MILQPSSLAHQVHHPASCAQPAQSALSMPSQNAFPSYPLPKLIMQTSSIPSLQLVQMLKPRQYNLLTRLLDLTRKEYLIKDGINLFPIIIYQPTILIIPLPLSNSVHLIPIPNPPDRLTYLIEIKHQIQFTHIPKETIQHLHKEMYRL